MQLKCLFYYETVNISGFIANEETGKVIKFKDYEKSEIEFFFVEGKPEGKKVTLTYTADGGKVVGKTSFRVFAPEVVTKELRPSKYTTVGPNGKLKCCLYYGKLLKAELKEGEPGIIISHEIRLPSKFRGHPHLLQYVQLVKEEVLEAYYKSFELYYQTANKEWCLDTCYPYDDPAANKVQMNDLPGGELNSNINEVHNRKQFQTYLMFLPSEKPEDESSAWVPLKLVEWDWRAGIKRIDWGKDPCDENALQILYKYPANPKNKDSKKHPEWTCNAKNNDKEKKKIFKETWEKAKAEQEKRP